MAHTPGPWRFATEPQPNGCPTVGHKGLMVCMVAHSVNHAEQKEVALANASLIAAAPDLLEACKAMADAMQHGAGAPAYGDALEKGQAAIAKAKGGEG